MNSQTKGIAPTYRPLYIQIREALIKRLASGDWPPGFMLPSEVALAQEYGVSQGTIRKALDTMAAERLVVRNQGRGTKVARHTHETALFQYFHIYDEQGVRTLPSSRTLTCDRDAASEKEAAVLGLGPGDAVVRVRRVRFLGDRPTLTETIVVSAALFPGLEELGTELPNAIYELYQRRYQVSVQHAVEKLYAVAANGWDAELLGIKEGEPLLEIHRTAFDLESRHVEYRVSRCLTDHYHYRNELV